MNDELNTAIEKNIQNVDKYTIANETKRDNYNWWQQWYAKSVQAI